MNDEQFEALAQALERMTQLQLRSLARVTQVQAQLDVMQSQLLALAVNQGGDATEASKQIGDSLRVETERAMRELTNWVADHGITPKGDDPWWDRPKE